MKAKHRNATINGVSVQGKAHVQPDPNYWIGVFLVERNLLDGDCSQWVSTIVEYEGPINCKEECTDGKGKAKIIHAAPAGKRDRIRIHVEAVERPLLSKEEIRNNAQDGYNANLPRPKVLN